MQRVAVITDIHANLPALQATLVALEALDPDRVYCGGDLVGYGPHPNQVCALIEERATPTIYGNYDYAIARDLEDCGCAYRDPLGRALGERSIPRPWPTPTGAPRTSCARCRSICASSWAKRASAW